MAGPPDRDPHGWIALGKQGLTFVRMGEDGHVLEEPVGDVPMEQETQGIGPSDDGLQGVGESVDGRKQPAPEGSDDDADHRPQRD